MTDSKFLRVGLKIDSISEQYVGCIDDLISHDKVQEMNEYKHHWSVTCFEHSLTVSRYSYLICKYFGLDHRSAARGGLLHDFFLYDWKTTKLSIGRHGFVHARIALNNATELFEMNEIEQDIILKHMFPLTLQPPLYKESLIVCLVDKYCMVVELMQQLREYIYTCLYKLKTRRT